MLDNGFVAIYRKIFDSDIADDFWLVGFFVYCICRANWKDGQFKGVPIKRGQFAASQVQLAEICKCSRHRIQNALKKLGACSMLEVESKRGMLFMVITVCNYDTYQDAKEGAGHVGGMLGAPLEHVGGTNEERNKLTKKQEKKEPTVLVGRADELMAIWNENDHTLKIRKLSDSRRQRIASRLKSPTWNQDFLEAITRLPLPGDGWQPDFDWMIANDTNVYKILEGKYNWRGQSNGRQKQKSIEELFKP